MLRFLTAFLLVALVAPTASAQTLDLIGTVELPSKERPGAGEDNNEMFPDRVGGSDVWAYTAPDGSEYAIMGTLDGIAIVAAPSLEVVATIDGPTERAFFYWRDIKTYGSFAYVTTEAYGNREGLMVIDLRNLPHSAEFVTSVRGVNDRLVSSHNLSIDTKTGHAWVLNSDGTTIVGLDLSNPMLPVEVGSVDVPDSHDVYAHDGTLYVAEGRSPKISVWNVTNPRVPEEMGTVVFPDPGYVHNVWPTEDGLHILTTEETANKTVKVWNIEDLENPELVAEWLGGSNLAHNVHVQGEYAIISHYSTGVSMVDISDPTNPVEVANFDTHPENDDANFNGNWGASLPTKSGLVFASDLEGTLTVLKWTPPGVDS
ncbi:MAG: choice-of-anchor B family protein [Bacteroidota bacterium]